STSSRNEPAGRCAGPQPRWKAGSRGSWQAPLMMWKDPVPYRTPDPSTRCKTGPEPNSAVLLGWPSPSRRSECLAASELPTNPPLGGFLQQPGGSRPAGQDASKLDARGDAELGVDLAQVILDRFRADEQPRADLDVGQAFSGQLGDLGLLGGQLTTGLGGALAGGLACGQQFAAGPFSERLDAHSLQHAERRAQLLARVGAAALAA